jgi:hypothetical protein
MRIATASWLLAQNVRLEVRWRDRVANSLTGLVLDRERWIVVPVRLDQSVRNVVLAEIFGEQPPRLLA